MAPEPDVLESDAPPSRAGRILLALVALALLAGALFWAEGLRRADAERDAVRRCGDDAAEAVGDAERRLALMAAYVSPVIGSTSSDTTSDVDTDLRQMIGDQAPLGLPPVEDALRACEDLTIWPLHDETRAARDAWVTLLEAERARLRQLAEDGTGFSSGFEEIQSLQEQAEAAQP